MGKLRVRTYDGKHPHRIIAATPDVITPGGSGHSGEKSTPISTVKAAPTGDQCYVNERLRIL